MVVFVDHGRDSYNTQFQSGGSVEALLKETKVPPLSYPTSNGLFLSPSSDPRPPLSNLVSSEGNRNVDHSFSAALSCYPVAKQIARSVDLNALHALSRTCRQFRTNLVQYRDQLVRETIRCRNEPPDDGSNNNDEGIPGRPTFTTGKVGRCARDMVRECQRCAKVVCRNCTMKPPNTTLLKGRLRRLCVVCLVAPLSRHLSSHLPVPGEFDNVIPQSCTTPFEPWATETLCACETEVWLCRPCGQTLRSEDTSYKRVWSWRTRYSAYLTGGLGTGIVECQGVKCGRGDRCLSAEDIEVEVDCDVDDWVSEHSDHSGTFQRLDGHGDHHHHVESRDDEGPGYLRQEIEGIGGVVKQKAKKRVRVGASVEEVDSEAETGDYLRREATGDVRSWCAWCSRVMPSKAETLELGLF